MSTPRGTATAHRPEQLVPVVLQGIVQVTDPSPASLDSAVTLDWHWRPSTGIPYVNQSGVRRNGSSALDYARLRDLLTAARDDLK
jgi:hypothetical protein